GGDALEYDIYLDPADPIARGGIDIDLDRGPDLRDTSAMDQNGLRAHGDADLARASGKWYHRRIPLDPAAGRTARHWNLVFEGDAPGRYVQFIDNVVVTHGDGSPSTIIYDDGDPKTRAVKGKEGYSQHVLLTSVPRSQIADGKDVAPLITSKTELW